MSIIPESAVLFLQKALAHGALEKGGTWGGAECAKAVPLKVHILESWSVVFLCVLMFQHFKFSSKLEKLKDAIKSDLQQSSVSAWERKFEIVLGSIHMLMFLQILYYKWNMFSLINMIQPCHMILLLQGIALFSTGVSGVLISSFMLPALTGTLLAMLFPETAGLTQPFEMEGYWLQHYLIQSVPIYLLLRRNAVCLRNSSTVVSATAGLWILAFLHFSLYEVIDVVLSVNVEFMLCPTSAMDIIFPNLPSWMFFPSYRSTLTFFVILVGFTITWMYLTFAGLIQKVLGTGEKKKML